MAGRVAGKVEPRDREAAPHTPGDGNVGRWAGLLASGSFYSRAFPLGPPSASKLVDDGDRAVANSGFVPGYSGGGRAGVTPASLFDPHEAGHRSALFVKEAARRAAFQSHHSAHPSGGCPL